MAGARKGRSPRMPAREREMPSEGTSAVGGAAGQYVRVVHVAHKPETEITEADVEKLLAWIERRWGKPERRDPNEANRWWDYLSSFRRESLTFVCEKVKDGPRPTLADVRRLCLQYAPKQGD